LLLVVSGVLVGRWYQHITSGFHCEPIAEKKYEFFTDFVRWRASFESIGLPALNTETTVIEFGGRIVYKATRLFQESFPYADHVEVKGRSICWDDGEFRFNLAVEEIEKQEGHDAQNRAR